MGAFLGVGVLAAQRGAHGMANSGASAVANLGGGAAASTSGLAIGALTSKGVQGAPGAPGAAGALGVLGPGGSDKTVDGAARQLESLFMQELIKSMRATTLKTEDESGGSGKLAQDMLDAQFAMALSGKPGGLSEAIARQLQRMQSPAAQDGAAAQAMTGAVQPNAAQTDLYAMPESGQTQFEQLMRTKADAPGASARRGAGTPAANFVAQHAAAAQSAEQASGIPASFMLAQAAHETGWGQRNIRMPDGSASNNLFGIKAGPGWNGPVANVTTTEYIDGQPKRMVQRFRAYASAADSFADYARMITDSPRYQEVARVARSDQAQPAAFAQSLHKAGYATDPSYAQKLTKVINTTVRLARAIQA